MKKEPHVGGLGQRQANEGSDKHKKGPRFESL